VATRDPVRRWQRWDDRPSLPLPRRRLLRSLPSAGAGHFAYGPSYYVPPAVVVTSPYFCAFHNDGFVSRIGLLDYLSGTHKIPLDAAATICPDGVGSCVFPSY
jgi:hypothetical protein